MQDQSSRTHAPAETWRAIAGLEGRYEISDRGRVRSLMRRSFRHEYVPRPTPLVMRLYPTRTGHLKVWLQGRPRQVHRLVLEAFVGSCPQGCEASHVNGDAADNRVINLLWESHVDNMQRKVAHGTLNVGPRHGSRTRPDRVARGERSGSAKVTDDEVRAIRALYAAGAGSQRILGLRFGLTQGAVGRIVRGENWAHV